MAALLWRPEDGQILSMLALPANQIDLWFCRYTQINDAALLRRYRQLLSAAELMRLERFRYAADHQRYLVARALLRTVLSRYAAVAPEQWRFRSNTYGKPDIDHGACGAACCGLPLSFNVSYTSGLILLGVTQERALGVDIENVRQSAAPMAADDIARHFAPHFFARRESSALQAVPPAQQQQRFYQYWTLKEAYLKARGEGLALAPADFSFEFTGSAGLRFLDHDRAVDGWRFWQLQALDDYLAAICVEGRPDVTQQLVSRQVVPLRSVKAMPCALLAQS